LDGTAVCQWPMSGQIFKRRNLDGARES